MASCAVLCFYYSRCHFKAQSTLVVVVVGFFFNIKSFALTKSLFPQRTVPEKRPLIGDTSSQGEFTGPAAHDADLKRRLLLS